MLLLCRKSKWKCYLPVHVTKAHAFASEAELLWLSVLNIIFFSFCIFWIHFINCDKQMLRGTPWSTWFFKEQNKKHVCVRMHWNSFELYLFIASLNKCKHQFYNYKTMLSHNYTCVMPVSSVQNWERIGCSWGWTYMWNSDSIAPVEVFNRTAGNSTATNTEKKKQNKQNRTKTQSRKG